jgi:Holliday junction resolvasome RuvABC DNA-binding subunit
MKRSIVRLIVAILGLVSSIVELAIRVIQLAILVVDRLARSLESRRPEERRIVVETPASQAPVNDAAERLTSALTGMGFRAGQVRAFAATVRVRLDKEPIERLVKEGIVSLSG